VVTNWMGDDWCCEVTLDLAAVNQREETIVRGETTVVLFRL
jgi:hypothetical protein